MEKIVINDSQVIPVKNVDVFYIDNEDRKKLVIVTISGFAINNYYDTEEMCRRNFKALTKIIEDYKEDEK